MKMMSPPKMRHFLLSSTLLIVILVMDTGRNANGQEPPQQQPQPNQPEDQTEVKTYGAGEHKLTMQLAQGSRILKATDADLNIYQNSGRGTFKGCNVTKEEGFFVVHYDEGAAKQGCAVDFITSEDMANKIKFTASVKEDPAGCLECKGAEKFATNENIVPFVFSQSNKDAQLLKKEPIYSKDPNPATCKKQECDADSAKKECISSTALEIRWSKCGDPPLFRGYLHQVGEPEMKGITAKTEGTNEATMEISGTVKEDGASFTILDDAAMPVCTAGKYKGIPIPKAWPLGDNDNTLKDNTLKDSYLFVFQLLPQSATRKYDKDGRMTDKPPAPAEGTPKCKDGLFIKFPTEQYTGILFTPTEVPTTTTTPIPTTTTTTAMTTTGIPTTGTGTSSTKNPSMNTTASGGPTPTAPCSSSAPPTPLPLLQNIPFLVSTSILFAIIIGLIIVIIIICRKNNQAKAAGPIEDGDGAGSKKDEDDGEEEEEDDEENNKTEEADGNKSLASQSIVPASSEEPYSVDHLLAPPGWVRPPRGKTAPPPQFKSGGPYPGGYKMGYKG